MRLIISSAFTTCIAGTRNWAISARWSSRRARSGLNEMSTKPAATQLAERRRKLALWRATTTSAGRIPRWATRTRLSRAGRLSNLMASRPAPLPYPKSTTINPKDSRYERGTPGGQVMRPAKPLPSRQARGYQSPSPVRQIACIPYCWSRILLASELSPAHWGLRSS